MIHIEPKMTPAQMVSLLDAALGHGHPLTFLDMTVVTFKTIGRHADGTAAAWMGCLYAEGEIEALMRLRAAWVRGEDRSPAEVAKRTVECRLDCRA